MLRISHSIALLFLIVSFGTAAFGQTGRPGISGQAAPDWNVSAWHQLPKGKDSLNISDMKGKVTYLYFFQSWCPGCHRYGFPTLKSLTETFADDRDVSFVAIQTTFEGHSTNTAKRLPEMADKYSLSIPFGQSAGSSGTPDIMRRYRSGGTPWTVIIDSHGRVRFNDFHISTADAERLINQLKRAR